MSTPPGLELKFACGLYDRMLRLYTGEIKPEGIVLTFTALDEPRDIFDRMTSDDPFDMAEMSISEYISRYDANQCPFVALPVFASRVFRHGFIFVNRGASIRAPKDLAGKRIGVPLYTMSAAVWIRGLLEDEYGVDLSGVTWVEGALKSAGAHGNPSAMPLLKPVKIETNTSGKPINQLLADGKIDAVIASRTVEGLGKNPDIVRLIPNFRVVEKDYYRRTRIFPIMHVIVIRREIYDANPFIAQSMYDAFCASKKHAFDLMRELGALRYMLPWLTDDVDEIQEVFGGDPWPYGVQANRPTLEALVAHLADQNLIARRVPIEELFVPIVERAT